MLDINNIPIMSGTYKTNVELHFKWYVMRLHICIGSSDQSLHLCSCDSFDAR